MPAKRRQADRENTILFICDNITRYKIASYQKMSATETSSVDPDLFMALCGLTSFVINASSVLTIDRKLTPAEVSVLSSLLTSGAEISDLTLAEELPPSRAINCSSTPIRTLLGAWYGPAVARIPELSRAPVADSAPRQLSDSSSSDWQYYIQRQQLFARLTTLRSLTLTSCKLSTCSVASLGNLRALESLNIWKTAWDAETLVSGLNNLPMLADLGIRSAQVRTKAARAIGGVVALGRIRRLRLGLNQLRDKGTSALADAILERRKTCELEELDLNNNSIGPTGGEKLSKGLLTHSPRLRSLNLSGNPVGHVAADAIGKSLAKSLGEIDVSICDLGPDGVGSVLGALSGHPALSVLRIGGNNPGDLGARAISRFLLCPGGRRLIELEMQHSGITEVGALELAAALTKVYTLERLDMCGNSFGPRGAAAVIDALAAAVSTTPMDTIGFQSCEIGDDGAAAVGRLIARRGCKSVFLNDNEMQAAGAKAIADSVAVSACVVEALDLSQNPIGDEGVAYLLDKIAQPRKRFVKMFNIKETSMGVEGAMAVKRAVEANGVLRQLAVSRHNGDDEADKIIQEVEHCSKPAILILL